MVATTGEGGELFLWEALTGDLVAQLTDAGDDHVNALQFAPDGLRLAATRLDGRLQIWDVAARRLEREMTTLPEAFYLSWSADGKFVAVGGNGGMRVSETEQGEITYARIVAPFLTPIPVALNADGSLAAYVQPLFADADDGFANVDIRRTDQPNRVIARLAHPEDICAVSFDPSGDRIATGAADRGLVSIWSLDSLPSDTDTTNIVLTEPTALLAGHRGAVCALEWSADGTQLVTGGLDDGTARLWDVASAHEVVRLSGPGGAVTSVGIADSGRRVVTATLDGVTRLWDLTPGVALKQVITEAGPVGTVVFSPDGDDIAVSSGPRVAVWDLATGSEDLVIDDEESRDIFFGLALSDDGRRLASTFFKDEGIGVYDTTSGELLNIVSGDFHSPSEMTFLPGTHHLAVANGDGTVMVWDADDDSAGSAFGRRNNFLLAKTEHADAVVWLDVTPDGDRIVTSSVDGTAIVWEANTLDVVATLEHRGFAGDVAISPDGQTVAVATQTGAVQIWDVASETLERRLEGHSGLVITGRFSPDGSRLATGGADGTARIWNISNWEQTRIFMGHEGEVLDVAFSPDGKTLATAGADGTIQLRVLDADTLIATARARVTRSLTDAECATYIPSGTCE